MCAGWSWAGWIVIHLVFLQGFTDETSPSLPGLSPPPGLQRCQERVPLSQEAEDGASGMQ